MSDRVNRTLVERLIREGHSGRSAARLAHCSEWSARHIRRAMLGDTPQMKNACCVPDGDRQSPSLFGSVTLAVIGAAFVAAMWRACRAAEGGPMP